MRILRIFTIPDLIATAEISEANADKYVRGLYRSGYLVIAKPKRNGKKGGCTVWRLVRDTGPRAPRMQTNGITYDPNDHTTYEGGIQQCQTGSKH